MLPDELLYSLLGRLVACNALGNPRDYLRLIFGTKDLLPSIDLPTSIESLHRRLGSFSPSDSAEGIINSFTIYPYHRPFLTIERHQAVQQILLHGGGKRLKTLLGRVANRFGANPPLQYCVKCVDEAIACHGMPYWRRMHQLPGVISCATHGIDLVLFLQPSTSTDRQRLYTVPCSSIGRTPPISSNPMQSWFAELSRNLLNAGLPVLNLEERQLAYESAAIALGFCNNRNRINYDALAAAVRNHYDDFDGFIHRDRLLSTPLHPLAWLRTLLGRPSRASHPICHLLLIGFLFKTIEGFKQALQQAGQIDTRHADVQSMNCESGSNKDLEPTNDLLFKDVALSCREVARAMSLSVTTVVLRRRAMGIPIAERRKSLNPAKLKIIAKALAGGLSPSCIGRRYRVSVATVYRVRAQSTDLLDSHLRIRQDREQRKRRRRWLKAIEHGENVGVRKIRSTDMATYAWLYRHDRTWLRKTCETLRYIRKVAPRVDWAARDLELCRRLGELVNDLRFRQDRPRISKTLLLRAAGDAMVRANLQRLPELMTLLEKLVESPKAFQLFRVDRAIRQLAAQGLPVLYWRIQRLAGIKTWTEALQTHADEKASELAEDLHFWHRP